MAEQVAAIEYGPAMRALTDKQQKFVLAMGANPFGSRAEWAIAAGYSNVKDGAKVRAHELLHDPKISAAVFEVTRQLLTTVGPLMATEALLRAVADPKNKQHIKAAELIGNRVGLHEVREIKVEHREKSIEEKIEEIKRLARMLRIDASRLLGIPAGSLDQPKMKVIEGKVDG